MPLKQYCCSVCGTCAPKKLLKHSNFGERMQWLRRHYKAKHPKKFKEWFNRQ